MAYWHDIYRFSRSIEHEFKFAGKYGAKGEKRQKRIKPTPEQIALQNQRNKETKMRRTIKLNFRERDLWCCCKYPAVLRQTINVHENPAAGVQEARKPVKVGDAPGSRGTRRDSLSHPCQPAADRTDRHDRSRCVEPGVSGIGDAEDL